jgi:hypothetical protein
VTLPPQRRLRLLLSLTSAFLLLALLLPLFSEENRAPVELFFRITGSVIVLVVAVWPHKSEMK